MTSAKVGERMNFSEEYLYENFKRCQREAIAANQKGQASLAKIKLNEAAEFMEKLSMAASGEYRGKYAENANRIRALADSIKSTGPNKEGRNAFSDSPQLQSAGGGTDALSVYSADDKSADMSEFFKFLRKDELTFGFEGVTGLDSAKRAVTEYIINPVRYPQAYNYNFLDNQAILLEGPPGTGKTTFAKAVAKETGVPFALVNSGALVNCYIGETGKNIDKTMNERNEVLKSLIVRLHNGENIDSVKKEFEEKLFKVSAEEVHNAMHELVNNGMSIDEAKRFFYIRTLLLKDAMDNSNITNNYNIINVFKKENRYIEKLLNNITEDSIKILYKELSIHYHKKESILFTALKSHGNDEPSKVMTKVDKDILDSLKTIIDNNLNNDDLKEKCEEINSCILDMIFKEENILIPLCIDTLSKEDFDIIENKYIKF